MHAKFECENFREVCNMPVNTSDFACNSNYAVILRSLRQEKSNVNAPNASFPCGRMLISKWGKANGGAPKASGES